MTPPESIMDKEARFRSVVDASRHLVYRVCRCYVADVEARQDVFQEVLVHIWKGLDAFEGKSQINTWIHRITVNTCLGHLRSEQRRMKHLDTTTGVEVDDIADPGADGDDSEEALSNMYTCIRQLPAVDRALVALFLEDLSTREIGEILGITDVNVRVKLHRVKKDLKDIWERSGYGLG
jgi:RNA polymerase sigma-70 factor, ECF subfamily